MKPRIAAICAIFVVATCVSRAPAQIPDCAHTSIEGQAQCQPGGQAMYVVNDRTDGQVEVTIHVAFLHLVPGNITSTNQVLTLAPGERRELGCVVYPPQKRTTWDLADCRPL